MYSLLTIKDKEYKLKMTTRSCVDIEKRLGTNPLNVFMKAQGGEIPNVEDLLVILHGCLTPLNNGIKFEEMYDLFDEYQEEGNTIIDLIKVLVDVFMESGFVPKNESKN